VPSAHRDPMGEASSVPALLLFQMAGKRLSMPLAAVRCVVPLPLLQRPLGTPYFVEGFFDFQGTPVAAVRLDELLEFGHEELGFYSPLIMLAGDDREFALHVAKVDAVVEVEAARIQPIADDETLNACVVGRISDGGETLYLLSPSQLLLAVERQRIAAHAQMWQQRLTALDDDRRHAQ
jgi:chemotaxis signal transduction protein